MEAAFRGWDEPLQSVFCPYFKHGLQPHVFDCGMGSLLPIGGGVIIKCRSNDQRSLKNSTNRGAIERLDAIKVGAIAGRAQAR